MSQQYSHLAKEANSILGCIKKWYGLILTRSFFPNIRSKSPLQQLRDKSSVCCPFCSQLSFNKFEVVDAALLLTIPNVFGEEWQS